MLKFSHTVLRKSRGLLILVEKGRRVTLGTKLSQTRIKIMAGEGRGRGEGLQRELYELAITLHS